MDDFHRLFEVNARHRILICLNCQYAIVPSQSKTHLQVYHKRLSLQQRRDLISKIESTAELARRHEDVVYPEATEAPVANLPVYFDGINCNWSDDTGKTCNYVCRTIHVMQEHCKRHHGWVNTQKRGGDMRAKKRHVENRIWVEDQACQRFFKVTSAEILRGGQAACVARPTTDGSAARFLPRTGRRCPTGKVRCCQ